VQTTQLYDHQEQEKYAAKAGVKEVLPLLPNPHSAQGIKVDKGNGAMSRQWLLMQASSSNG
jgi:hypothetical protein